MTAPQTTTTNTHTAAAVRRDWRAQAACIGTNPELFFPVAEAGPVLDAQVAAAKAVCARCPVRAECLTEALARIPHGIAGGLTEDERRTLRHRGRQDCTPAAVSGPCRARRPEHATARKGATPMRSPSPAAAAVLPSSRR